ncbi:MAG: CGNR zinc finger domain-containing protein [Candidatus Baltobacteraceae bacterium]
MTTAVADEAPGTLEIVRLFENTLNLPDGPDQLDTVERAAAWCRRYGLPVVADEAALAQLREFREALRDVLFANNGEGQGPAAWTGLREYARAARLSVSVDSPRGLGLRPEGAGADRAIASVLAIVYEAIVRGTWARLRACRKSSCRFAYYDRTKNASRAWCSMATCGNQEKAQRRRERTRQSTLPA